MYKFKPMRMHYAKKISEWKYDGYMETIYMKPYFDHYNELTGEMKGPLNCDGFAVFNGDDLFGLFEYYLKEEGIEIGLAIHPDYVGKGLSKDFVLAGIQYAIKEYKYSKDYIFLAVDIGNVAAYKSYLKVGFVEYERNKEEIMMRYKIKGMC